MSGRLIFAISSTILEEAALAAGVIWGLPRLNIRIPLWGLILAMIAWAAYSIITYRMGSRALKVKQVVGLEDMIGCKGEVVNQLSPEGMVRIKGELWAARSAGGELSKGIQVIVVAQQRLKLIVRETGGADAKDNRA